MLVVPGQNFEIGSERDLRQAYAAYLRGGDGKYSPAKFRRLVECNEIHLFQYERAGEVWMRFAMQIRRDHKGVYAQWLYVSGTGIEVWGEEFFWLSYAYAWTVCSEAGSLPARMKLGGRRAKAWRRWLARRGVQVDQDGMISGNQEVFGYGQ